MCKRINIKLIKDGIIPVISLGLFFLFWELYVIFSEIPLWLLPRPSAVVVDLFTNFGFYLNHLKYTMTAALSGLLISIILSSLIAIIFIHSKIIEKGLWPLIISFRIIPSLALAPFLTLIFGIDINSKIAMAAIISFFPILIGLVTGLNSVDKETTDLFKSFNANKYQSLVKLKIPTSLPYFFSGLKVAATLSITGAFVGEFIASDRGLGFLIITSSRFFNSLVSFSSITMIVLAGLVLFGLVSFLEKKILFWKTNE